MNWTIIGGIAYLLIAFVVCGWLIYDEVNSNRRSPPILISIAALSWGIVLPIIVGFVVAEKHDKKRKAAE